MKQIYISIMFSLFFVPIALAQATYNGNGSTGFGGPVGQSSLQLSDDGTTITGVFTKGTNADLNNELVIYIDSKSGGFNSTANFNDPGSGDKLRRSIAGYGGFDGATRSVVNFPSGFEADYAIAINTSFGGLWELVEGGAFPFVAVVGNPSNGSDTTFMFSFKWSELGIPNENDFDFIVTYLDGFGNNGVFRSDEGYGAGLPSTNPGGDDVTFNTSLNFEGAARTVADGNWSSSAVWINGSIPGSDKSIVINNDINADLPVTINNSITVNNGNTLTIAADQVMNLNGTLTNKGTTRFVSNASGTAQLINSATAVVNGAITVERFIPAQTNDRRAFRFVTSSVSNAGSIFKNWQDNGNTTAGIGTHITGSDSGANGFDATASGAPSMFGFDNQANSANQQDDWFAVPNTNSTDLVAGVPYRLFIRGDRNYDLTSSPAAAPNSDVVLRATGDPVLTATTVNTINANAGKFSMIGNPFQAVVDYRLLTKNNINPNFIYVWNANAGTSGAYETINVNTTNSQEIQRLFVQPGQSFFVATAADGAASLTFDLDDRAPTSSNLVTFSSQQQPRITVRLTSIIEGKELLLDRLQYIFNDGNEINLNDSFKIFNPNENLATITDGNMLAYESRALPTDGEELPLQIFNYKNETYTLELQVSLQDLETTAVLYDRYLNTSTLLQDGLNAIDYTVNADAGSTAADRFVIQFSKSTASTPTTDLAPWKIYPNPSTTGNITITGSEFANKELFLQLYNVVGQQVLQTLQKADNNGTTALDLSQLPSGLYLLKVNNGSLQSSQKLLIN